MEKGLEKIVEIPDGVEVKLEGHLVKMIGPKGTTERNIVYPGINIKIQDKSIIIKSKKNSRNEKRILGTFSAHLTNMVLGVLNGYTYKLKICSGHFPMKVVVEDNQVVISNFLGEKVPRRAKILQDISVKVEKDIILVEGVDKEKAGQTMGNIERATKITNRDKRVFQDGCYLISN